MAHSSFIKELNKDALKPYLTFQYSVLGETFFKGVYKLEPGHFMLYSNGELEIKRYAEVQFDTVEETLDSYRQQIQQTLRESVKAHRISDVKVGSFLSGGVDSSYITALLMPDKTFSIGFESYEAVLMRLGWHKNYQISFISAIIKKCLVQSSALRNCRTFNIIWMSRIPILRVCRYIFCQG